MAKLRSLSQDFQHGVCPSPEVVAEGILDPSSAAFGKIGDAYAAEVFRWANAQGVPVRRFAKGGNQGTDRPAAD